jgi:hypothetical protein
MKIYHVAVDTSTAETEALRAVKPPRLLLSYQRFKNKPLSTFTEKLGYVPEEIVIDCGAFSGKGIALTDYMTYLKENENYITHYMSLDVVERDGEQLIVDAEMTYEYYCIMKRKGFNPIPVIHYGYDPEYWLQKYLEKGETYIALGATVPVKNKWEVSEWVRLLSWQYPEVKFHLLGSSSRKILDHCDVYSVDSSTWFMMAINGYPKHIKGYSREAKIERAKFNLQKELELVV